MARLHHSESRPSSIDRSASCPLARFFSPVCCLLYTPCWPSYIRQMAGFITVLRDICLSITKQATFDYGSTIIKHASSVTTLDNFTRRLVDDVSNVVAAYTACLVLVSRLLAGDAALSMNSSTTLGYLSGANHPLSTRVCQQELVLVVHSIHITQAHRQQR